TFEKKCRMDALEVLDISQTQETREYISKFSDYKTNTSEDDLFSGNEAEENFKVMTFDEFINRYKNESN
ncbi:11399_t:CDS:2, partial [Racocetra persica]